MNLFRRRWTLRARISFGLLLTAALLSAVTVMTLAGYQAILTEVRILAEVEAAQLRAVGEAGLLLAQVRAARRNYFRTADPAQLLKARDILDQAVGICKEGLRLSDSNRAGFAHAGMLMVRYRNALDDASPLVARFPASEKERSLLHSRLAEMDRLLASPAEPTGSPQREQQLRTVVEDLDRLERLLMPMGPPGEELATREKYLEQLATAIETELDTIADLTWQEVERERQVADARTQHRLRNLLLTLLSTLVLLGILMVILPARIASPLSRLRVLVRRIGHGEEESIDPGAFPDDETRRLAEGLAGFLARTRETQKLQRGRIRLLELRLRALLQTLDDGVLILDRERNVLLAGRSLEELLGTTAGEMAGRSVADLLPESEVTGLLERALSEDRVQAEVEIRHRDGGRRGADVSVQVLRDEEQRTQQYLLVIKPGRPPAPGEASPPPARRQAAPADPASKTLP